MLDKSLIDQIVDQVLSQMGNPAAQQAPASDDAAAAKNTPAAPAVRTVFSGDGELRDITSPEEREIPVSYTHLDHRIGQEKTFRRQAPSVTLLHGPAVFDILKQKLFYHVKIAGDVYKRQQYPNRPQLQPEYRLIFVHLPWQELPLQCQM